MDPCFSAAASLFRFTKPPWNWPWSPFGGKNSLLPDSDRLLYSKNSRGYFKCVECRVLRVPCDRRTPACDNCTSNGRPCHYDEPDYPTCVFCKENRRSCEGVYPCHQCCNSRTLVDCEFDATLLPTAGVDCEPCKRLGLVYDQRFSKCQYCIMGRCIYLLSSGFHMRVALGRRRPPAGLHSGKR
jgi:hypothetical protein